jgi:hypothetical protein
MANLTLKDKRDAIKARLRTMDVRKLRARYDELKAKAKRVLDPTYDHLLYTHHEHALEMRMIRSELGYRASQRAFDSDEFYGWKSESLRVELKRLTTRCLAIQHELNRRAK